MVEKFLRHIGENIKAQDVLYKAVVWKVFLYGRESWIATDVIMMVLEDFQHRVDRRLAGLTEIWGNNDNCEWPPVSTTLKEIGFWLMQEYVRRRQDTISEYIVGRPIFELCTRADRMEASIRFLCW